MILEHHLNYRLDGPGDNLEEKNISIIIGHHLNYPLDGPVDNLEEKGQHDISTPSESLA